MYIPVFIINLKSSIDRKNYTVKQLNNLGILYQVIEAVDKDHPSVTEILSTGHDLIWKNGRRSRYLLKEEIGCTLSHMKIYQKMIVENIEMACVLEDDNDYNIDFKDLLDYNNLNVVDWDLLHLGHHSGLKTKVTRSRGNKDLPVKGYKIGIPVEVPLGTYAYIIKKNAAEILFKNCHPIRMPADHYTGNAGAFNTKSYILIPPCAFNNPELKSTIYNRPEHTFLNPGFETMLSRFRKIYILFPGLRRFRVWLHFNRNFPLVILRKLGVIRNTYSKIK